MACVLTIHRTKFGEQKLLLLCIFICSYLFGFPWTDDIAFANNEGMISATKLTVTCEDISDYTDQNGAAITGADSCAKLTTFLNKNNHFIGQWPMINVE